MFNSYAQNFEDVILWRALKHIENGFYIDVGAQDPLSLSVSRGFYDLGWRGIHAEATSSYAQKLRADRPDEVVVEAAIGTSPVPLRFFEIPETGLSTGDERVAQMHEKDGFKVVEVEVPSMPLSALLNMANDRDVHWLKIDVEGMEAEVIASWRPSSVRPWVVVVESTAPLSDMATHEAWEDSLLSLGYRFVYFDQLNRFYVSEQHLELVSHFGSGPTFVDKFFVAEKSPYASLLQKIIAKREQDAEHRSIEHIREREQLERTIQQIQERIVSLEAKIAEEHHQTTIAHAQLHDTYHSLSWRLTRPLRDANLVLNYFEMLPRRCVKHLMVSSIIWLSKRPHLKDKCVRFLRRFPKLRDRLEGFARSRGYGIGHTPSEEDGLWHADAPNGALAKWHALIEGTTNPK